MQTKLVTNLKVDTEIVQLTDCLVGLFSTLDQVNQDLISGAEYVHAAVSIRAARVSLEGLDGVHLYIEQTVCMPDAKPYRVRLYQFLRDENGTIINRIYRLKNEENVVGAFSDSQRLENLDAALLLEECGCHMTWAIEDDHYSGYTGRDGKCISRTYKYRMTAEAILTQERLIQLDVGYDGVGAEDDGAETSLGNRVMGPPEGVVGHIFKRLSACAFHDFPSLGEGGTDALKLQENSLGSSNTSTPLSVTDVEVKRAHYVAYGTLPALWEMFVSQQEENPNITIDIVDSISEQLCQSAAKSIADWKSGASLPSDYWIEIFLVDGELTLELARQEIAAVLGLDVENITIDLLPARADLDGN